MKYKVLVIDDKPLIRRALLQTIHWEALNCEVIGEAENGIEAIKILEKERPHLIISDIKMPGIDGLELTSYVKKQLPNTEVIMITGYQEFEYAKQALTLGVFDLLLKPIDNGKMEKTIQNALDKLNRNRELAEYQKQLVQENSLYKNRLKDSASQLRDKLILDLIEGRKEGEDLTQKELAELALQHMYYCVIIARIRSFEGITAAKLLKEAGRILHIAEPERKIVELVIQQDMVFVLSEKKTVSSHIHDIHIKKLLARLQEEMGDIFGEDLRICFSVSRLENDIRNIKETYKQSEGILDVCYFLAQKDILFASQYSFATDEKEQYSIRDLEHFYQVVEGVSEEEIEGEIEKLMLKIIESSGGNEFKIKCLISEICITLLRHFGRGEYLIGEGLAPEQVIGEIDRLTDADRSREYLKNFIEQIRKDLQKNKRIENPLVRDSLEYLKKNYKRNITLSLLAERLNANSSYLSRLLKKETGKNFVDILTAIRINTAKQLLDEPGSKIVEVGEKVGYTDYAYFYQVFKKWEGISPSDYRKRGKNI